MRVPSIQVCLILLVAGALPALAGGRSGGNYTILTENLGPGGQLGASSSGEVQMNATLGTIVNTETGSNGVVSLRNGFVNHLVFVSSLAVSASPTTVVEQAGLQLLAPGMYDDDTVVDVFDEVQWSVDAGPISGVDGDGVAQAAIVYEDTPAAVSGHYQGISDGVGLLVLNVSNDDFGSYAGDGVSDAWQVQYFGEDNPLGIGSADADGDRQNNQLEFAAMTIPTDEESFLQLGISRLAVDSVEVSVDPTFLERDYRIQFVPDLLSGTWTNLVPASVATNGTERTYLDAGATSTVGFYRLQIDYTP